MTLRILRTAKDNDLYYYAKEIEINGKRFKTPFSLLHKSIPLSSIPRIHQNEMYEIWKSFRANDIQDVLTNASISRKITSKIASQNTTIIRNKPKTFFLAFSNFTGNPLNFFEDQLIEFLIDSIYLHTDIVTFPIIRQIQNYIINQNQRDQYIDFIRNCYNIADTLNNKPIMAIIPPLAPGFIPLIVKEYLDLDIKIFCFNFDGAGLSTYYPLYFQILRTIYRYDRHTFENKIKYITNLKLPVNRNRHQPYPAEDMITPSLAVDIIGFNHLAGGSRPQSRRTTRTISGGVRRSVSNTNLLNLDSYSYFRIPNMEKFNNNFDNPIITPDFNDFSTASYYERNIFRRKFNYLNMNKEMLNMHNTIINNNPIKDVLFQKEGIRHDLNAKVSILDRYINNRSIIEFLS